KDQRTGRNRCDALEGVCVRKRERTGARLHEFEKAGVNAAAGDAGIGDDAVEGGAAAVDSDEQFLRRRGTAAEAAGVAVRGADSAAAGQLVDVDRVGVEIEDGAARDVHVGEIGRPVARVVVVLDDAAGDAEDDVELRVGGAGHRAGETNGGRGGV